MFSGINLSEITEKDNIGFFYVNVFPVETIFFHI